MILPRDASTTTRKMFVLCSLYSSLRPRTHWRQNRPSRLNRSKLNMFNLVDFVDRAVDAVDSVDRLVDSGDFNKIDRVEVDFVASVYEALVLRSGSTELVFSISINRKNGVGDKDCSH